MNKELLIKIQKLLSLSHSSNEYEAQSALLKAQELMVKHNLNANDLEALKEADTEKVVEDVAMNPYLKSTWRLGLAGVIADNFKCYAYGRSTKNRASWIVFLGKERDVEICKTVYAYALNFVEKKISKARRNLNDSGRTSKNVANDYALGFSRGLSQQFESQKRSNESEWGLVLVKPQDVVDSYNNIAFGKTIEHKLKNNRHYYNKGLKDGREFTLNALNGEKNTQKSIC